MADTQVHIDLTDAIAEALASWWYNGLNEVKCDVTTTELTIDGMYEWDELSPDAHEKRIFRTVAKRFLQSEFVTFKASENER